MAGLPVAIYGGGVSMLLSRDVYRGLLLLLRVVDRCGLSSYYGILPPVIDGILPPSSLIDDMTPASILMCYHHPSTCIDRLGNRSNQLINTHSGKSWMNQTMHLHWSWGTYRGEVLCLCRVPVLDKYCHPSG